MYRYFHPVLLSVKEKFIIKLRLNYDLSFYSDIKLIFAPALMKLNGLYLQSDACLIMLSKICIGHSQ
jgi:hypothetical protein